jgi:hypothetical protein
MMTNPPNGLSGLGGLTGQNLGIGSAPGTVVLPNGTVVNGMAANSVATIRGMSPSGMPTGGTAGAVPGTLVSRGLVPGASAVTSGGMVAAIGVSTPAGTMTPVGVRLPNGMVNNNIVLRACVTTPNCTAAHPCGLTPTCGGAVAVNLVANNAIALASALQAQGVAGGVMQAGGMGMLVNPITNQPINGLTMAGYPQVGYPPIGYAPMGYAPGYPRYAAGMTDTGASEDADESEEMLDEETEETSVPPGARSTMPVPRFHPIPSKPAFQRSEGMTPTPDAQRTVPKPITTVMTEQRETSEQDLEAALDRAYLEGVSAAMNEVERKLAEKRQAAAKVKLQEKILLQADHLQQQLDEQERLQMLAMQRAKRERQLRQQAVQQLESQQLEMAAVAEPTADAPISLPQRLPQPKQAITLPEPPKAVTVAKPNQPQNPAVVSRITDNVNVNPIQLAGSLKSSVAGKVNGALATFLGTGQEQAAAKPLPLRQNTAKPQGKLQPVLTAVQSETPAKPPVASGSPKYGLLPDASELGVQQAQFTADDTPIVP